MAAPRSAPHRGQGSLCKVECKREHEAFPGVQSRPLLVGVPAHGKAVAAPSSDILLCLLLAAAKQGQKAAGTLQEKGSAPAPKTSEDKAESKREADTVNFAASESLNGWNCAICLSVVEQVGGQRKGWVLLVSLHQWFKGFESFSHPEGCTHLRGAALGQGSCTSSFRAVLWGEGAQAQHATACLCDRYTCMPACRQQPLPCDCLHL